jgi:hypothetical protein
VDLPAECLAAWRSSSGTRRDGCGALGACSEYRHAHGEARIGSAGVLLTDSCHAADRTDQSQPGAVSADGAEPDAQTWPVAGYASNESGATATHRRMTGDATNHGATHGEQPSPRLGPLRGSIEPLFARPAAWKRRRKCCQRCVGTRRTDPRRLSADGVILHLEGGDHGAWRDCGFPVETAKAAPVVLIRNRVRPDAEMVADLNRNRKARAGICLYVAITTLELEERTAYFVRHTR